MSIQADQQERGQHGQHDRASHPLALFGHWPLPQVQPAFPCLNCHVHSPASRRETEHGLRSGRWEIGHETLHVLRPSVAPCLGADARDIAQLRQRSGAHKDPGILATTIGLRAGATVGAGRWEMWDHIAEMCAMGTFACPWHGKHLAACRRERFDRRLRRIVHLAHEQKIQNRRLRSNPQFHRHVTRMSAA